MSFTGLLIHTMDVKPVTIANDGYGGQTETVGAAKVSGAACRINQLSANERYVMSQERIDASHIVFCDAGLNILATDVLVISGNTYQVKQVHTANDSTGPHHMEIMVRRLTP